jgi:uncharacterized protein YkwD
MRTLATLAALALATPAFAQTADEQAHETVTVEPRETPDTGPRADLKAVTQGIAAAVNAFREKEGREPVEGNDTLAKTAQAFADFMATTDKYGHTADGRQPWERAKSNGYDYCIVLENIAYAFDSRGFDAKKLTDKFVVGWENSPGHRRNMLDRDVSEAGVGVARSDKTGHYYAVQMFGRPKSAAIEFSIKNKAGVEVTYKIGDKSYTLQPHTTRTHTTCRPPTVTFGWDGAKPLKPTGGEKYTVTKDGEAFAVTKSPAAPRECDGD